MSKKKKRAEYDLDLDPNERLLWSGSPPGGILFRPADIFLIPFSLLWGGFALVWTIAVTLGTGCGGIFGLPFVLIGMYFVFGRFLVDARQREKTIYAVTNERVIIVSGLFNQQIKSLNLRTLSDITLNSNASDRGTITFGQSNVISVMYRGMPWPGTAKHLAPTFEMIDDAKYVYHLIRQAQRAVFMPAP